MDAKTLKEEARRAGAELVGIAPASRWEKWPGTANPRNIQPLCQSVIVLGRSIVRGALRGVEEGTNFGSTYHEYGKSWNERTFLIRTIHQVAHAIEAAGAEAVPLLGGGAGLDTKALARGAGLGSVGKGGFFLTREFGHRQRFGLILADLVLEGDAPADVDFCDGCDACLKACPLSAMAHSDGGLFSLNTQICGVCQNGKFDGDALSYERLDRIAAACGRACMVALEDRIDNKFHGTFRKRSIWTRDLNGRVALHPLATKGDK